MEVSTVRLRISHIVVQPVLVYDDGEELSPGPQVNPMTVALSQLAALAETIPGDVAALQPAPEVADQS